MNRDDDLQPATPDNAPPTDAAGRPVNVVERDLRDKDSDTRGVDETITPFVHPHQGTGSRRVE